MSSFLSYHRLGPLRIGFPYELLVTFPVDYLGVGDTVRASLRRTPGDAAALADFTSDRLDELVTLTLTAEQTENLAPAEALMEMVQVVGAEQYPILGPRFLVKVEHHPTRNSNP